MKGLLGFLVAVSFIALIVGCDFAHYSLKGNVYKQYQNERFPVEKANISLHCQKLRDQETTSDSNGIFVLEGIGFLDDSECSILVEHPDFKPKELKIGQNNLEGEKGFSPTYVVEVRLGN